MSKVKPFCIATEGLTFEQACEILDKSIKAGAEPYKGIVEWEDPYYFPKKYPYSSSNFIGVDGLGRTNKDNRVEYFNRPESSNKTILITFDQLDEHLGLKRTNKQEYKDTFTKSDLEVGMIVQFKDGRYAVKLSEQVLYLLNQRESCWVELNSYTETLECEFQDCTIDKVFKPKHNIELQYDLLDEEVNDIIWDRSKSDKRQQLINQINELQKQLDEL